MDHSQLSYIIAANAPEELNEKFWNIKKKYNLLVDQEKVYQDSIITLNIAHITVKRGFYLKKEAAEEQLLATLDAVEKKLIKITANTLEIFKTQDLGNVLVALVEKTDVLQQLHEDVVNAVSPFINSDNRFEGNNFKPHLSVAYNIPAEKLSEILYYTKGKIFPINFSLDNLYVLKNIPGIKKERAVVKHYSFK